MDRLGLLGHLANRDLAPGTDLDQTYHLVQVPLAVLIFLMIGLAQWLKYKSSDIRVVLGKVARSLVVHVVMTGALLWLYDFRWHEVPRVALLFATLLRPSATPTTSSRCGVASWTPWVRHWHTLALP